MLSFLPLLFLVALVPAPLLAIAVFVVRLRGVVRRGGAGGVVADVITGLRGGVARPVWPVLIAVVVGAAALALGLGRLYLAAIADGSRWGFDEVLLAVVLGIGAAIGWAVVAGVFAAAVARARGFGAGAVAGSFVLLAVAVGTSSALPLLQDLAAPGGSPAVAGLGERDLLSPFEVFLVALVWALPWPVLGAALGARDRASDRRVRDVWQLLLDLATADLPPSRSEWGTALRAELAVIEQPVERRRFALGGVWTALRAGAPRRVWIWAVGVAVVVAGGSFAASRWSLAHDRAGVLAFWMAVPSTLLFAVALTTAWHGRSFGSGMRAGALAGAASLVAVLAVGVPEAVVWAQARAGYLSTGDAVPPTWQAAVGDVLRPEFLVGMAVLWAMSALGGTALGTALGRLRVAETTGDPADAG
jgi:hypothetical protein